MARLSAFSFITLNGYVAGPGGDIRWHRHGAEENRYAAGALKAGNILLFGRVTYDMMAGYWPTDMARQNDPLVAEGMNSAEKIVFSRTLGKAAWSNTAVVSDRIAETVGEMKRRSGKDMTILGSGSIVSQFADQGLIDEYQIMVDPVALGGGVPAFRNITRPLNLRLTGTQAFSSGVVLLSYEPADSPRAPSP